MLTLRVRMPIVPDLLYPRNFITKIIKYDKVVDIPNSMTVLPELLPYSIEMVRAGEAGTAKCAQSGELLSPWRHAKEGRGPGTGAECGPFSVASRRIERART